MADETEVLVENATRGDRAAVDELLARFLPDLQRYVRRHAAGPVAEREASADLVQSVCRELLERLEDRRFRYRGEAEFRKWMYGAAIMKISNRARFWRTTRRDTGREEQAPGSGSAGPELQGGAETPSAAAERNEELDRLRTALELLPSRYREILSLAHVDGLPHAEIAERLGVSEGHSRVILSRALARLARLAARE